MLRKLLLLVAVIVGTLVVAGVVGTDMFTERLSLPHRGYVSSEVFVDVQSGDSSQVIAKRLADAGVVRDDLTFRLAVWQLGLDRSLQAGEYHFDRSMSALQVADKISRGRVYLRSITFPEGLTIEEMAAVFHNQLFGSSDDFLAAAQRVELVADLDTSARNLEGYLFPETYALPRDATAEDLVEVMVLQFRQVFTDALRAEARLRELTIREVVTLASLIQKETGRVDEHALVSAVYTNRLRIGMPLQCDPTVIYGLQLDGLYDGNLTRKNLRHDSPYNTYVYGGLPPGPIAAPGQQALEAVFKPADVSYLYFVSRNDGTHEFADTLREHNRNVQRYQVRSFRRLRAERR